MINKNDFEKTAKRYEECWALENHDYPLLQITAPKAGAVPFPHREFPSLRDRWTDTEYIIRSARHNMENTYYGGESYPILWPNLGPDIFGAAMGCALEFGESTSWAVPSVTEWSNTSLKRGAEPNAWERKIRQMTADIAADAQGDYIVGITDLHAGLDGLVSLRGPEELCLDLIEEPEQVSRCLFESLEWFQKLYSDLYATIAARQQGSTNWMGIYHPDKWYVTSCDFMGMISGEMFRQFVLPELLEEVSFLENTVFHLDGPGALRHLDELLKIQGIGGIQWVYGAGQPSASHWIPVLQKIQKAGKMIHVNAEPEDLPVLKEQLRPEGLILSMGAASEEDAKALEASVRSWRNG